MPAKAALRSQPKEQWPEVLTVDQLADIFGVSPWTIYHWAKAGKIPHTRMGGTKGFIRIAKADLLRLLEVTRDATDDSTTRQRQEPV